jgi:AcrR family transcriptional regulator
MPPNQMVTFSQRMPRDAEATRTRILDAAIEEFSEHGLAGARIDRIAEAAAANKRSIYVYFESKERLFDTALHQVLTKMIEDVPLTENDLPGYAGRLFDYHLARPQGLRMNIWRQLERPASGPDAGDMYANKVTALAGTPTQRSIPPTDLIVLINGLAYAWLMSPRDLLRADGSDPDSPARLAQHRAAITEAARRMSEPG